MSTLAERIACIIQEHRLKQREFAADLGISVNYVNLIVNGKKERISPPLAKLIGETYGYSPQWVLTGEGGKYLSTSDLDREREDLIARVNCLTPTELRATLAFLNSIDSIERALTKPEQQNNTPERKYGPRRAQPGDDLPVYGTERRKKTEKHG